MIHYVYKLTNKKSGSYYIGSRSYADPLQDNYLGSSIVVNLVISREGRDIFVKDILMTFNTRKEAIEYEQELIKEALQKDAKKCYNKRIPGDFKIEKSYNMRADIWNDYYEDIRKEYVSGASCRYLASVYRCDSLTIRKVIGELCRKGYRPDVWEASDLIVKEYLEGKPVFELRIQYKCDAHTISTVLKSKNVDIRNYKDAVKIQKELGIRKKVTIRKIDVDLIRDLYLDEGLSINDISAKLNLYNGTVSKRLIAAGVPIRKSNFYRERRHKAWNLRDEIRKDSESMNKGSLAKKYKADRWTINKILDSSDSV